MRIGTKLGLGLAFHYLLIITSLLLVLQLWVLPRIVEQERATLLDSANAVKSVINQEQSRIGTLTWDWAHWDDTYFFAAGQNPEYMERNVSEFWFGEVSLDGVAVRDKLQQPVAFASRVDDRLPDPINKLRQKDADLLLLVDGEPALVSIYELYDSQSNGPSTGELIFYRYLDQGWLNEQLTDYNFTSQIKVDPLGDLAPRVEFISDTESRVSLAIPLRNTDQQLTLILTNHRDNYQQVVKGLHDVLLLISGLALLGGILTYVLLQKVLSRPLRRLESRFVEQMEQLDLETGTFDDARLKFKSELDWLESVLDKASDEWNQRHRQLSTETQRYREASLEDPLTKIGNRRFLQLSLLRMMSNPRASSKIMLFSFDIDHFKSINDNYGHDVGDLILKQFTRLLTDLKRPNDLLARVGGEEFMLAVLGSYDDQEYAAKIAERLRTTVAQSRFGKPGQELNITTSIGFVTSELSTATDWEALMKLSDIGLYQAKNTGRNRAVGYEVNDEAGLKGIENDDLEAAIRAELITPIAPD